MAARKDFVKRIVKEMVDYYLYHRLYDVTAHVVYVPHEKATIAVRPLCDRFIKQDYL